MSAKRDPEDNARLGREATKPRQIPARGLLQVAKRVAKEVAEDDLGTVASSLAFFALLGLFPAVTAMVTLYGLIADPQDIRVLIGTVTPILPKDVTLLIDDQLTSLLGESSVALSLGLITSLLVTMWSVTNGMHNLIQAINRVYEEKETRSFLRLRTLALMLTVGAGAFFFTALALITGLPLLIQSAGFEAKTELWASLLRWPLLAAALGGALAVLYRLAPNRHDPRWQWVSWGAVISTLLWLGGSIGFSYYVSNFANYNGTYGTLGAVVVLLLWLYLSAFIVLLGAEINSELEHQTARDSTVGPERPMGARGAYVADNLPEKKTTDRDAKPGRD